MSEPCVRGCTYRNRHQPPCACTTECPEHPGHCKGCLPREADTGRLCVVCTARIVDDLAAIPELTVHVAARSDGRLNTARRSDDPKVPVKSVNRPSPSPAWDTAEDVVQWAFLAAMAAADDQGHAGPFQYRVDGIPARNLTQLLGYIRAHVGWFATYQPVEFYDEVTGGRRHLTRVTGHDRLTHRLKVACPSCNLRTLIREDGSDNVSCRNQSCGRIWREGEFDWLAHTATA